MPPAASGPSTALTQACCHATEPRADVGMNVPTDLCPAGTGCPLSYHIMSYMYLAEPADASPAEALFPWGA